VQRVIGAQQKAIGPLRDRLVLFGNGIKLSSNALLYQSDTCYSTRLQEERVRLGPAFDSARLDPVWSVGVDHQRGQGVSRACGAEPSQGIDAADPLQGHALPLRRYQHAHADQIVDQGKDGQFLQHPDEALTVQHIQAPGLLEVLQSGLAPPAHLVQCGQCVRGRQVDRQEGRDQRDRLRPKARVGHTVAPCAHAEHRRERRTQFGRHPGGRVHGWAHGFDPLDAWVCHTQLAEPAGAGEPLRHGPRLGRGVGTSGGKIHHRLLLHAKDGMEGLMVPQGQMGKGTARPIPYEPVPRSPQRLERRHLGHVVGMPGRREHLSQETRAGRPQREQVGHGEPTPGALPTGLAKVLLEFRGIGHGKTGPVYQACAVALPPSLVVRRLVADRCCPTQQWLPNDEW
jgi:hypothetical protein